MTAPTSMAAVFRKRVSPLEKVYLALDDGWGPFVNQMVVEGRGRVDPAALQAAMSASAAVNPGACLRHRGILGRMTWVVGPEPRVSVIRGAAWDGRSGDGAPFLQHRLDAAAGPSCEVQLVETADRTYLVFRSHHAVMDGVGTRAWAEDVLRALRGEAPVGNPSPLTDLEFVGGAGTGTMAFPARDALHPCGRADAVALRNESRWRRVTLPIRPDVPVVAAIAVALAEEARRHGRGAVRFNIPVNLRPFRKEERSTGNAVNILVLDVPEGAEPHALAAGFKDRLRAREQGTFPAGYRRMAWLLVGAIKQGMRKTMVAARKTGREAVTGAISHPGAFDVPALAAPGFSPTGAFWVPPMGTQGCSVVVSSFGEHLDVMLSLPEVLSTRGRFEVVLDRLVAALGGEAPRASMTA